MTLKGLERHHDVILHLTGATSGAHYVELVTKRPTKQNGTIVAGGFLFKTM